MATTKTLFGAWTLVLAVATSDGVFECKETSFGLVNNMVSDSSGNVWVANGNAYSGRIGRCPGVGNPEDEECIWKNFTRGCISNIAVDDSGPNTLVYTSCGGDSMQCIWDDDTDKLSCSEFKQHFGTMAYTFVDHGGNVFQWFLCDSRGKCMAKCSATGDCEAFGGNFAGDFEPASAVTDFQGNIYTSKRTYSSVSKSNYGQHAKCTSTGECAEVEFTGPDGSQLRGAITIGLDDHVYMADYEPSNSDELGLFRCSLDNVCEHFSALSTPEGFEDRHGSYLEILLKYGFSVGRDGDFYSFNTYNCDSQVCQYKAVRRCLPPQGKDIQI